MTTPTLREAQDLPALLPCPFCGAKALLYRMEDTRGISSVECKGCDAELVRQTATDAVAAWNSRAALAAQPAQSPTWPDHMPLAQRLQLIAHRCSDHEAVESLDEVIASLAAQPAPEAIAPPAGYAEWAAFYGERATNWMTAEEIRAGIGKLATVDAPSPELLLVHAMRLLAAQPAPEAGPLWLYIALCDLVDEAGALGTAMERPEVLRRKLATVRDAVGATPIAQPAPAVAQQGGRAANRAAGARPSRSRRLHSADRVQQGA